MDHSYMETMNRMFRKVNGTPHGAFPVLSARWIFGQPGDTISFVPW